MAKVSHRPRSEAEWLKELSGVRSEVALPGFWKNVADNCAQWAAEVSAGPFWAEAKRRTDRWRMEYRADTGAELLSHPGLPQFISKSEQSIRNKLFRRCNENADYLGKAIATSGPPIPRLGDLVRTRLSCPYIDGVEFLATKLIELASEMNTVALRRREGRLEGYFAQHVTVSQSVFYRLAGHSEPAEVRCEIQVASEMATRMWNSSHVIYQAVRDSQGRAEDWQWKPTDPRFISNQLGHMIHLADGLLVQLRQSATSKKVDK